MCYHSGEMIKKNEIKNYMWVLFKIALKVESLKSKVTWRSRELLKLQVHQFDSDL